MAPMSTSSALVASSSRASPPIEEDSELPMDLSQLPSIPVAKSLLLINNFVANTTRFLNHFAYECEDRIMRVSTNVTRVEVLLAILEAKLNSIPDLNVTDSTTYGNDNRDTKHLDLGISDQDLPSMEVNEMPLPPPPPPITEESLMIEGIPLPPPPTSIDGLEGALVVPPSLSLDSMPPPPPSLMGDFDDNHDDELNGNNGPILLKLKDDPVYAKYFAMRRLGIPDQVIEHKLMMDGINTNILNMDPEGPSPSGKLASTIPAEPTGPMLPIMAPPPPSDLESDFSDDEIMELPPPPLSLLEPNKIERRSSENIGLPFPPPPPLLSPTSSIGGPASLFGDGPPPLPSFITKSALSGSDMGSSSDDDIEEFDADELPVAGVMKLKDDPAFEKYFKMRKLGMPDSVIQHKLNMDGVTLDILRHVFSKMHSTKQRGTMDPDGISPNATSKAGTAQPPLPPGLPPPPAKKYEDSDSDFDSD
ncbi:hypothetical protein CCR75_002067 [Bremia lactucae]|uniref:WASH complex subunit 3 n=1 Tax=Bremia lactucae TaxID=4779 RepID=A0A976NZD0_BRELC|nr:hypothetical protein CCR75_002067 [Bremia lactucae]